MIKIVLAAVFGFVALSPLHAAPRLLFPGNVDCSDFGKVGAKTWDLRRASSLDLGNWDGQFVISGPIVAGRFVAHGHDLFDVLESKCKVSAAL